MERRKRPAKYGRTARGEKFPRNALNMFLNRPKPGVRFFLCLARRLLTGGAAKPPGKMIFGHVPGKITALKFIV
jgi:hypothetical protein